MEASTYLWVSAAIGLAQVADCALYFVTHGRASKTAWLFSTVEWIWGGVSVYVLFSDGSAVPALLPVIYVVYLLAWAGYGIATASRHKDIGAITLTPGEVVAGGAFGFLFASAACALALR
jgi:hypothetical protein